MSNILQSNIRHSKYGSKANNLLRLRDAGFLVPDFAFDSAADLKYPLIARSSTLVEDNIGSSGAGQSLSISNIKNRSQLHAAIAQINVKHLGATVIVQQYISPKISGVIFTSSPEDPDQMIIEYSDMPEGVTAASLVPHQYIVGSGAQPPHKFFADLIETASAIAQLFGTPQDIEWIYDDRVWIVQSRPITTTTDPVKREISRLKHVFGLAPPRLSAQQFTIQMQTDTPRVQKILRHIYSESGPWSSVLRKYWVTLKPYDTNILLPIVFGRLYLNLDEERRITAHKYPFWSVKKRLSDTKIRMSTYYSYKKYKYEAHDQVANKIDHVVSELFQLSLFIDFCSRYLRTKLGNNITEGQWESCLRPASVDRDQIINMHPSIWDQQMLETHFMLLDFYSDRRMRMHDIFERLLTSDRPAVNSISLVDLPVEIELPTWDDLLLPKHLVDGTVSLPVKRLVGGVVKGAVGTVMDIKAGKKVDILVVKNLDPALLQYFGMIGGIISEAGGLLSHGTILAREKMLPTVLLPNALQLLENHEIINLNANTQSIELEA
jgi:phosphohistidine swiveling domain-containing protein